LKCERNAKNERWSDMWFILFILLLPIAVLIELVKMSKWVISRGAISGIIYCPSAKATMEHFTPKKSLWSEDRPQPRKIGVDHIPGDMTTNDPRHWSRIELLFCSIKCCCFTYRESRPNWPWYRRYTKEWIYYWFSWFFHCVGFLLGFSYAQKYMNQKNGRKSCKNNPYPGFLPDRGLV
jgi:hypothetical protein